jgi:hypothetical protein
MSCNFIFIFQFPCPKSICFSNFYIRHYSYGLCEFWIFLLWLSNLKMKLITLNTSFHIDLGRFVCDWTNIIQIFKKVTTMFIWIILKNLVWTYRECNFCQYWVTILCIHPNKIIIIWQLIVKTIKLLYYQQIRRLFVNEGKNSLPLN